MEQSNNTLKKSINAAKWGYAGTAIKLILQILSQIILARLLGPEEYGLFAIGIIVSALSIYIGDIAGSSLIGLKSISKNDIRFAITWQIIFNFLITLVIYYLSDHIGSVINNHRSSEIIRNLSVLCTINAIGGISYSLLRRNLDFKFIQISQLSGFIIGYYIIGIPYAYFISPTVESLVYSWITQSIVTSLLFFLYKPHSFIPLLWTNQARIIIKFSLSSMTSNFSTWASTYTDKIIISKFIGISSIGLYTTSYSLLSTPLNQIFSTFQQISFSSSSKTNLEATKTASTLSAATISIVMTWFYASIISNNSEIVDLIYGNKWSQMKSYIIPFSVLCIFQSISGSITPFLWGSGFVGNESKIQLLNFIFTLISSLYLSIIYKNAQYVAWGLAIASFLRCFILTNSAIKNLKWDKKDVIRSLLGIVFVFALNYFLITTITCIINLYTESKIIKNLISIAITPLATLLLIIKFSRIINKQFDKVKCLVLNKIS